MRDPSPPKYLAHYTKIFLVISIYSIEFSNYIYLVTIYSMAFVIQGSFLKNWDKTKALV